MGLERPVHLDLVGSQLHPLPGSSIPRTMPVRATRRTLRLPSPALGCSVRSWSVALLCRPTSLLENCINRYPYRASCTYPQKRLTAQSAQSPPMRRRQRSSTASWSEDYLATTRPPITDSILPIQGAPHAPATAIIENVSVGHRRAHVLVTEELLDGSEYVPGESRRCGHSRRPRIGPVTIR